MGELVEEVTPPWCSVLANELRRVPGLSEQAVCDVMRGWTDAEHLRFFDLPYAKKFDLLRRIGRR